MKGTDSIKIDGVYFVKGQLGKKTLKDFQEHEAHHGLAPEVLKEAYVRLQKHEVGYNEPTVTNLQKTVAPVKGDK